MGTKIQDIAYYLPEKVVTNEDLQAEHPSWEMSQVEARAGVHTRHIAGPNETALDLSLEACKKLFDQRGDARERLDGLIFCTQSEDYIMPPNSCLLHEKLGLSENVFAFDFNLACSGYIYGLALARGLVHSGMVSNMLLVTADTYSKYINKGDRSARVLFGDGAAVTLITASDSQKGIIDIVCATSGKNHDAFMIPAGGCRIPISEKTHSSTTDHSGNVRSAENIHMDGMDILTFVNSKVPEQVRSILARNSLTVEDIDLYVFHQASRLALDSLTRLLKLKPEKVFRNLGEVGNAVSASIPIALKDALDSGKLHPGEMVLLSGFGVGLSWGTAIVEI